MIHVVPLKHLPEPFTIPQQLRDRFGYDDIKKTLYYDGVMSKLSYDRLRAISSDYDYQRAIEELFRRAVPEPPRSPHVGGWLVGAGALALIVLVGTALLWQRTHSNNTPSDPDTELTEHLASQ